MNNYRMVYVPYERYGSCAPRTVSFKAPDDFRALVKASPLCFFSCGAFNKNTYKKELEELEIAPGNFEDLKKATEEVNGDGYDYLLFLENETTGEILWEDEDYAEYEEEEDEDEDEWEDE